MSRYEVFQSNRMTDVELINNNMSWLLNGLDCSGMPYIVASFLSLWALLHCYELPPEPEKDYANSQDEDVFGANIRKPPLKGNVEESSYTHSVGRGRSQKANISTGADLDGNASISEILRQHDRKKTERVPLLSQDVSDEEDENE